MSLRIYWSDYMDFGYTFKPCSRSIYSHSFLIHPPSTRWLFLTINKISVYSWLKSLNGFPLRSIENPKSFMSLKILHVTAQFTSPVSSAKLLIPSLPATLAIYLPVPYLSCLRALMLFPLPGDLFPTRSLASSYSCSKALPAHQSTPGPLSLCPTAHCLVSHKSSIFAIICGIIV